jgi:hypothetical protein
MSFKSFNKTVVEKIELNYSHQPLEKMESVPISAAPSWPDAMPANMDCGFEKMQNKLENI